jgi:hypothetical protein
MKVSPAASATEFSNFVNRYPSCSVDPVPAITFASASKFPKASHSPTSCAASNPSSSTSSTPRESMTMCWFVSKRTPMVKLSLGSIDPPDDV